MPTIKGMNADVYFGPSLGEDLPDWRKIPEAVADDDDAPDPKECPADVKAILGFDPDELYPDDEDDAEEEED